METTNFLKARLFLLSTSIALTLALLSLLNTPCWLLPVAAQTAPVVPSCVNLCAPAFYGSYRPWMLTATQDWYQHADFWCGIANVHAVQIYDWQRYSSQRPAWDTSQEAIYTRLNDIGSRGVTSPWGYGGGYVKANISYDTGTDPRALAFALWYESPPTKSSKSSTFHNWIYRTNSVTATYGFSSSFGQNTALSNDPLSVTVDGGAHSFVVDGVWASGDPSLSGATVYSIDTWDPWLSRGNRPRIAGIAYNQLQNQVWSLTDWTTNPRLWGEPYTTNYGNDPDPQQPPLIYNYYVPPFSHNKIALLSHHWVGYYITIEQDRVAAVDYNTALDQNGQPAPHNSGR